LTECVKDSIVGEDQFMNQCFSAKKNKDPSKNFRSGEDFFLISANAVVDPSKQMQDLTKGELRGGESSR